MAEEEVGVGGRKKLQVEKERERGRGRGGDGRVAKFAPRLSFLPPSLTRVPQERRREEIRRRMPSLSTSSNAF